MKRESIYIYVATVEPIFVLRIELSFNEYL